MEALLAKAQPIARSPNAPIIVLGETGTGKEVLARALHANSPRAARPFVAVNVAALPTELLESEFFGHVKGAFTGAVANKEGLFEAARGGTLFLDEIAEMPGSLQAKLLRALQDGEIRRIGSNTPFRVDVRIVCATHRDLYREVEEGRFRADLYYRLKVFTLTLPPLRERRADILPLARAFRDRAGAEGRLITRRAEAALLEYGWPGNVRELENAMIHAVALAEDGSLDVAHLPDDVVRPRARTSARPGTLARPLEDVEREHVLGVLALCDGKQAEAARVLEIGRNTLWRKLREWGVDP